MFSRTAAAVIGIASMLWSLRVSAQACCAGSNAVTPARLGPHEDAIAGVSFRMSEIIGSFDPRGKYTAAPANARELDLEQDIFGGLRVLPRAQLALLVPWVETYRKTPTVSETGGGLGDINLAARYDFALAREYRYVPGIGLLLGVTFPTGTAVEDAHKPLATDATGIGTFQGTLGIAIEQIFGSWIIGLSGWGSKRSSRSSRGIHYDLATQFTALASAAYVLDSGASFAAFLSYASEGNSSINDTEVPQSSHRLLRLTLAGLYPPSDRTRLLVDVFLDPPIQSLSANQPASLGGLVGFTWSFL